MPLDKKDNSITLNGLYYFFHKTHVALHWLLFGLFYPHVPLPCSAIRWNMFQHPYTTLMGWTRHVTLSCRISHRLQMQLWSYIWIYAYIYICCKCSYMKLCWSSKPSCKFTSIPGATFPTTYVLIPCLSFHHLLIVWGLEFSLKY